MTQNYTEPSRVHPPTTVADPVVEARNLTKRYGKGDTAVTALNNVSVGIERGAFTAIMGPSGSGKSTLMHCLAGLESITEGHVRLGDIDLASLSQRKLTTLRRDRIGFIFQAFNLVPTLSAVENITLPSDIAHRPVPAERLQEITDILELTDRLSHRPSELSGGQQQRVAIARALLSSPEVIFADEPTGNLDSHSTTQVLDYLRAVVDTYHQTIVMVTHEAQAAAYADRVLFLTDGQVVAQLDHPTEDSVLDTLRTLSSRGTGKPNPPSEPNTSDTDTTDSAPDSDTAAPITDAPFMQALQPEETPFPPEDTHSSSSGTGVDIPTRVPIEDRMPVLSANSTYDSPQRTPLHPTDDNAELKSEAAVTTAAHADAFPNEDSPEDENTSKDNNTPEDGNISEDESTPEDENTSENNNTPENDDPSVTEPTSEPRAESGPTTTALELPPIPDPDPTADVPSPIFEALRSQTTDPSGDKDKEAN